MRLGNYFLADGLLQSLSAISATPNEAQENPMIGYYSNNQLVYLPAGSSQLLPIPMSDEILKKCGFRFDTYFKLWQKMKTKLGTGVDMELNREYSALDFSHRPILKKIEYLHHLQNLYYVLKRNDLKIDVTLNEKLETHAAASH